MAEDRLRKLLVEAERGTLEDVRRPAGDPANGHAFADAAAEYRRYIEHDLQRRPSTMRDYRNTVEVRLVPKLGADTPLADITTDTIDRLREDLLAGGLSTRSVQRMLTLPHGILKRAKRLKWIDVNPAEDAERIRLQPSGDFNVLSPPEVMAVAAAAPTEQDTAPIVVAAFTGLRSIPQIVALFQPALPVLVGTPCAESQRAIRPIDSPSCA